MAEEKNLVTAEEKQEPMEVKVESLIQIVRQNKLCSIVTWQSCMGWKLNI